MKKFSIILLGFLCAIIGLPNVNAESYESYNIGDAVIFNGVGGHVIEDSDSSSDTVKVIVDGWNKTKKEWFDYWNGLICPGKTSNCDLYSYVKDRNVIAELIGIDIETEGVDLADLDKFLDFENYSYEVEDWWAGTVVVNDPKIKGDIPSWLLSSNINIYGFSGYTRDQRYAPALADYGFMLGSGFAGSVNDDGTITTHANGIMESWWQSLSKTNIPKNLITSVERTKTEYKYDNSVTICGNSLCEESNTPESGEGEKEDENVTTPDEDEKEESKCETVVDKSFTINYNSNGGNAIESLKTTIAGDSEMSLGLEQPTKGEFVFAGWYYDEKLTDKVKETKLGEGLVLYSLNVSKKYDENDCHIGYGDLTLYAKWEKTYEESDVKLVGTDSSISNVSKLNVVKIEEKESLEKILNSKLSTFEAYEIDLLDEKGEKVQPTGKVKLMLPIPKELDKEKLAAYRVDGEKLVEYDVLVDGDSAIIETDHFSTYILGEKVVVNNPDTGDNILLYFGLGLIAIIGSLVVVKKLKSVK